MKSKDRVLLERQKRSMMISILALLLIILGVIILLWVGSSNGNISGAVNVVKRILSEVWEEISFRTSNFLSFLKS